jgi:hypothetical protein
MSWTANSESLGTHFLVELASPAEDRLELRVDAATHGWMPVARATSGDDGWRVRALLAGHEEVVESAAAARQCLFQDLHEAFPGVRLELHPGT